MWIALINSVYKLPRIIDVIKTSKMTIILRTSSLQGPTKKLYQENSNVDPLASLTLENRKIITLERQLMEGEHNLEITLLKHDNEINMLKNQHDNEINMEKNQHDNEINMLKNQHDNEINMLKNQHDNEINMLKIQHDNEIDILKVQHTLDILKVEQGYTNWKNMRHINALNIRSFVYEFETKWFSEFSNLKTRKEKYTALAEKNIETLQKYYLTEMLFVDFVMRFYKRQCESAHPEFNVNSVITIPEGYMLKQDFKVLGMLWILFPLPTNKLVISTEHSGNICIEKYMDINKDD